MLMKNNSLKKGDSGAIGQIINERAPQQWMMAVPELALMVKNSRNADKMTVMIPPTKCKDQLKLRAHF